MTRSRLSRPRVRELTGCATGLAKVKAKQQKAAAMMETMQVRAHLADHDDAQHVTIVCKGLTLSHPRRLGLLRVHREVTLSRSLTRRRSADCARFAGALGAGVQARGAAAFLHGFSQRTVQPSLRPSTPTTAPLSLAPCLPFSLAGSLDPCLPPFPLSESACAPGSKPF